RSGAIQRKDELKIYGMNACLGFFRKRNQDLIRVYLTEEKLKTLKEVISFCVNSKLAYHIVGNDELENISESKHHEGVVFLVKNKKIGQLKEYRPGLNDSGFMALENVSNPHNIGAVLRSMAHFGLK